MSAFLSPAEVLSLPADLNREDKGPQRVFEGRKYTAEIEFFLPLDLADENAAIEWLEWEIGGGSIEQSNPYYGNELSGVTVVGFERTSVLRYTDWGAEDDRGGRKGRGVTVFEGRRP